MANIFLFTGENTHGIRTERQRWAQEFAEKHGAENLTRLDAQGLQFRTLLDDIGVLPFIAEKRLVIVSGIPRFEREQMEQLPSVIHPACILLFVESSPDKRLGGTKALLEIATVKTFPVLTGKALSDWLQTEAKAKNYTIDSGAIAVLIDLVGDDQDMLASEIEKLSLLGKSAVTADDVRRMAVPSGEREVWQLMNEIAAGDAARAIRYARSLQSHGEDPMSLWNILLWIVRSLGALTLAAHEGHKHNPAKAAAAAGVPFPTARSLLPLAQKISVAQIHELIDWAAQSDLELKTGGYRMTTDARQEVQALIDECLLRCCGVTVPQSV
jgi:DNA polymerase-3 subunit delta